MVPDDLNPLAYRAPGSPPHARWSSLNGNVLTPTSTAPLQSLSAWAPLADTQFLHPTISIDTAAMQLDQRYLFDCAQSWKRCTLVPQSGFQYPLPWPQGHRKASRCGGNPDLPLQLSSIAPLYALHGLALHNVSYLAEDPVPGKDQSAPLPPTRGPSTGAPAGSDGKDRGQANSSSSKDKEPHSEASKRPSGEFYVKSWLWQSGSTMLGESCFQVTSLQAVLMVNQHSRRDFRSTNMQDTWWKRCLLYNPLRFSALTLSWTEIACPIKQNSEGKFSVTVSEVLNGELDDGTPIKRQIRWHKVFYPGNTIDSVQFRVYNLVSGLCGPGLEFGQKWLSNYDQGRLGSLLKRISDSVESGTPFRLLARVQSRFTTMDESLDKFYTQYIAPAFKKIEKKEKSQVSQTKPPEDHPSSGNSPTSASGDSNGKGGQNDSSKNDRNK